jgi:hypothetical protein
MQSTRSDPTFPYLFYKNKDVAMHNKNMLLILPCYELVINEIVKEEENHGNALCHLHTTIFPPQLVIKLNMRIEIYVGNYDSQDGFVNGANGSIKAYNKIDKVDMIWIMLYDTKIGHRQANKLSYLYKPDIYQDWISIL